MAYYRRIWAPPYPAWSAWESLGMVNGPISLRITWSVAVGDGNANCQVRYIDEDNEEREEVCLPGQVITCGNAIFDLKASVQAVGVTGLGVDVEAT